MKRTLALLTVILLAVCLLAVSVSAQDPTATSTHRMQLVDASDNTGNLSAGSITGMPGKNITVPVTLDNAGELYEFLLGSFGNNVCDLENDLTELYTTYYNTAEKYAAGEPGCNNNNWVHAGYTILGTNQWMTEKWLGTAYADFGSYTINREWANAAVVAVYEGEDGHIEFTPLGMGGGKYSSTPYAITKNGRYGEYPVHGDDAYGSAYGDGHQRQNTVDFFLTGERHVGVDVVAVTVINMDNAKLQRNLDPYKNGLAMITWLFDQKIVGTINHKFDKYDYD